MNERSDESKQGVPQTSESFLLLSLLSLSPCITFGMLLVCPSDTELTVESKKHATWPRCVWQTGICLNIKTEIRGGGVDRRKKNIKGKESKLFV